MITGKNYRISVITGRLIRMEWSKSGTFTDENTQMVTNRDFDPPAFTTGRDGDFITIDTGELFLRYDEKEFSSQGLMIDVKSMGTTWHYSVVYGNTDRNLLGTARTLDETNGFVRLDMGIFGRNGYGVIDDSSSAIIKDGEYCDREAEELDIYFFGYGRDFRGGLQDFFKLCGQTPMIPRYALGNWWSRYYRYSAESYRKVLENFEKENIPLSVAVLDMDWHVTDVDPKYGTGWSGFSWNRELFPDPKAFLKELNDRSIAVTLNLHPADGIRAFEDMYEEAARDMGIDPKSEEPVEFDFSDRDFRRVYFEKVMRPYEDDGVSFWWIDWQQGTRKGKTKVDPLFLLNHYHYEDQKERHKRAMIFSRYAGVGSHRYPVGFSGDTHMTWESLAFQPFFTFTASNIGYGWWSHDIGGHMLGGRDDERLTRWVQFGVFSPIMRLHSSCSPFMNKEPWTLDRPYRDIIGRYMRLRHELVPYLYTMNRLANTEGRMLMEPMYYEYPEAEDAYEVKGEYLFGTELIAGIITKPLDDMLRMSSVNMYIPEGKYYDIFTGTVYRGETRRNIYRDLEDIPVLLKSGGIVPLAAEGETDATRNPRKFRILAGYGTDGSFTLYEDDGKTTEYETGQYITTRFILESSEEGDALLTIEAARGETALIPEEREYEIVLYGAGPSGEKAVKATAGEIPIDTVYDRSKGTVTVGPFIKKEGEDLVVKIGGITSGTNDTESRVFDILDRAWCENLQKEQCLDAFRCVDSIDEFRRIIGSMDIDEILKDALREISE